MKQKKERFLFLFVLLTTFIMLDKGVVSASEVPKKSEYPYIIEDGAVYYESSDNFGSGRNNIVNANINPYVNSPCYAAINGYSFLDKNGRILDHYYLEETSSIEIPPKPIGTVRVLKHFRTVFNRNGWVDSQKVLCRDGETVLDKKKENPKTEPDKSEKNAKELADMIDNYEGITVVLVDRSSSMDEFAEKATREFRKLDIDEATTKVYVFGRYFKEIKAKDVAEEHLDVRKDEKVYDLLAEVINDAGKYNPKHLVILTDLGVYEDEKKIKEQPQLETIDIIIPNDTYNYEERSSFIGNALKNATIKIKKFKE